ncbi:MAG: c-type cytochrome [Pseudohongiellaceae bacterium]
MKNSVKVGLALASLALGQCVVAQDKTVNDGVFTAAQVETGKLVYDSNCSTCHDMRFYRDILKSYNNQPVLWLWESILGTMPADNPGSLMLDEYTDVIAYILSENGFPAGDAKLDPDNGMGEIKVLSP